jgi:hypothetical protein
MTSEPLPHWDLSNVYPGLESEQFGWAVGQDSRLETQSSIDRTAARSLTETAHTTAVIRHELTLWVRYSELFQSGCSDR